MAFKFLKKKDRAKLKKPNRFSSFQFAGTQPFMVANNFKDQTKKSLLIEVSRRFPIPKN
jgi:hypothetical protein